MSNTFNFKRFVKYLTYDLVIAWRKSGINVIATAMLPLWFYIIFQVFSLIFEGHLSNFHVIGIIVAYAISFVITSIACPVKLYGGITKKKTGTDWLLIPASSFEKFLSMVLVCCIAVPILWFGTIAACDGLMELCLPKYDGMGLPVVFEYLEKALGAFSAGAAKFVVGSYATTYLNWCANVLTFALGAIFFRKNKVVYTFLTLMAIGMLISIGMGIIAGTDMNFTPEDFTDERMVHLLNVTTIVTYIVEFTLILGGLFLRIKTLKH